MKWLVYLLALCNLLVLLYVHHLPVIEEPTAPPAPNLPRVETLRLVQEPITDDVSGLVGEVPVMDACYVLSGFSAKRAVRDWARLRDYPVADGDITRIRASGLRRFRLFVDPREGLTAADQARILAANGISSRIASDGRRLEIGSASSYGQLLDQYRLLMPFIVDTPTLEYASHEAYSYGLFGGAALHDLVYEPDDPLRSKHLELVPCESVANAEENP